MPIASLVIIFIVDRYVRRDAGDPLDGGLGDARQQRVRARHEEVCGEAARRRRVARGDAHPWVASQRLEHGRRDDGREDDARVRGQVRVDAQ